MHYMEHPSRDDPTACGVAAHMLLRTERQDACRNKARCTCTDCAAALVRQGKGRGLGMTILARVEALR